MVTQFVFLANDPGGYDVIRPVYKKMVTDKSLDAKLFLTGSAGKMESGFQVRNDDVIRYIHSLIRSGNSFLLVTGSSIPPGIELEAIKLCKENGIITITILDYWLNYVERFSLDGHCYYPDFYFVMDGIAMQEAIEYGVPEEILEVVGQPGLDKYIYKRIRVIEEGNDVCFLSQPLSAIYGDRLGYNEITVIPDVLRAVEASGNRLKIKFHPRETSYIRQTYNVYSEERELEEVVKNYKYIIGMNTMAMLQCILMGAKVLCYEPNMQGDDFCICNKLGLTTRVDTYDELNRLLLKSEPGESKEPSNLIWLDGNSTDRCLNRIMEISEGVKYG